ncbi:glycosyltransferase family 2 protein [Desulfovibrio sp. OttesenSCG-928-I05]|nr:glycosyltransferase family 2 protein [Desulfovibrio sp. OttesenSCG-928-I05]
MKLSVSLVSFNEEANIRRTLEAVRDIADEIVIVDSFSTDNTVAIAGEFGAKVTSRAWPGYHEQKNVCLELCSGEWVLCLDCDEVVSPELLAAVKRVLDVPVTEASPGAAGYTVNRRTHYLGRLLRHAWQPDRKLRLVRRNADARWDGGDPHPFLAVDGTVAALEGDLIHYSFKNFDAHMNQTRILARQMAENLYAKGKKSGAWALLLKPPFLFLKRYFFQGAILDGVPGLIAALSSAAYVYMKYAYLWELRAKDTKKA